jgi:hypothetical protein
VPGFAWRRTLAVKVSEAASGTRVILAHMISVGRSQFISEIGLLQYFLKLGPPAADEPSLTFIRHVLLKGATNTPYALHSPEMHTRSFGL